MLEFYFFILLFLAILNQFIYSNFLDIKKKLKLFKTFSKNL